MNAAALSRALAAASLDEYTDALSARLDELNALGRGVIDKKALLELLKQAGCSKMGVRQRLAAVLTCELMALPSQPPPASGKEVPSGDAFWGHLASSAALDFDDLPPPSSAEADRALMSAPRPPPPAAAVAPLPPAVLAARTAADRAASPSAPSASSSLLPPPAPSAPADAAEADAYASAAAPALSAAEQQAELCRKLGDEAFGRKDVAGAERWFAQGLALCPQSADFLSRLADCASAATPPEHLRALEYLRTLLALPVTPCHVDLHVDAQLRAARCCKTLGKLAEARTHCEAAVGLAPPPPPPARPVAAASGAATSGAGPSAASAQPLRARASESLSELLYAEGQVERARVCAAEGRVLEALQASRFIRQACQASLLGTTLATDALEAAGRLEEAIGEAQEGVDTLGAGAPGAPRARLLLARLLARKGRAAEAEAALEGLEALEKASALSTRSAEARAGLESAAAAFVGLRQAMRLKAEGNAAYGQSQFERAITLYTEGLEVDVARCLEPALLGNRSSAYAKVRSFSLAVHDLDRALLIDEDATKLRLRRAAFKVELGDLPGAVVDYETVLEREPESPAALAGLEHAEEVESGADGRKGGMIEFEDEKLDPYAVLDLPKDCNAVQIKAAFRKLALKLHPDKQEGVNDFEKEIAARQFRRVRIAHAVLSDPAERNRLDEEGVLHKKGGGAEEKIKPFHEYYSINTPDGYTRGGDFVSTRRYDPMVGAVDSLGRVTAAEKLSRKQIAAIKAEEVIRLKGPQEHLKLGYHDSANAPDQYNTYWDRVEKSRALTVTGSMKELSAPNTKFFGKEIVQPKLIAQTRYMPLEVEERDEVQRQLMKATPTSVKGGHRED